MGFYHKFTASHSLPDGAVMHHKITASHSLQPSAVNEMFCSCCGELAIICSVNGHSSRMSLSIKSYWGESVVNDAMEVLFALPISLVGL